MPPSSHSTQQQAPSSKFLGLSNMNINKFPMMNGGGGSSTPSMNKPPAAGGNFYSTGTAAQSLNSGAKLTPSSAANQRSESQGPHSQQHS